MTKPDRFQKFHSVRSERLEPRRCGFHTVATVIIISLIFALPSHVLAEKVVFNVNDTSRQISMMRASGTNVNLSCRLESMDLSLMDVNGEVMHHIAVPGVILPRDAGDPDLPSLTTYVAIPRGAEISASLKILKTQEFTGISVSPAPVIPFDTDPRPLHYEKNMTVYGSDRPFPEKPLIVSDPISIRGVDAVIVSITPFQFNPSAKTLTVLTDVEVELSVTGGVGEYGGSRLRNRFFEPMLRQLLVNYESLPHPDFDSPSRLDTDEYEYVIIVPDDADFISAAERLRDWRVAQGISTGIFTLTQTGSTSAAIEQFINNAYNTWTNPPVAILLMSDYPSSGKGYGITSPVYSGSYGSFISDNLYADVDGDMLPDINMARMTAQNATHLQIMVDKVINYEQNPITDSSFYAKPVIAGGWQSDRWFILCTEIVWGFLHNELGKEPIREYAGTSSAPSSWSTNSNTSLLINYFGPSGLGYIPASPWHLNDWGGNATRISTDINNGTFLLLHRDHGDVDGWSDPAYTNSSLSSLNNGNKLPFVFSINCLTGKFNSASTCFVEAFHRMNGGALGMIGATEVSYSFVNDAYVFGMIDSMWPEFDPGNNYTPLGDNPLQPGFANVAGKYYLQASNWPSNPENKRDAHYLFHMHGDAFTTLYSEVPQHLTVTHDSVLLAGPDYFTVTADSGSLIALSVDDVIIGRGTGQGTAQNITIAPQLPPAIVTLTVTKPNYYRYSTTLQVIPPDGPYVIYDSLVIDDSAANGNGRIDYNESFTLDFTVKNVGNQPADSVTVTLSEILRGGLSITDGVQFFGTVPAGQSLQQNDAFSLSTDGTVSDLQKFNFTVSSAAGDGTIWASQCSLTVHAPEFEITSIVVDDSAGNVNGRLDPGETGVLQVTIRNKGSADALNVMSNLHTESSFIQLDSASQAISTLASAGTLTLNYPIAADSGTPSGVSAVFTMTLTSDGGYSRGLTFSQQIGKIFALIYEPDPTPMSGTKIQQYLQGYQRSTNKMTVLPDSLSDYEMIFVLLGVYSNNHVLTQAEGQKLADFLAAGGRIYMEGGDTWAYDSQTPVHAYFHIDGTSDGSGDISGFAGVNGTFTSGLNFTYTGENNFIDRINPVDGAVTILVNQNPVYNAAICYNGGGYRTFGANFELGGLQGNRNELLKQILFYFGYNEMATPTLSMTGILLLLLVFSLLFCIVTRSSGILRKSGSDR